MKTENNEAVLRCYAFYTTILVVKVGLMALLTAIQRFRKRVFISPEDSLLFNRVTRYVPVPFSSNKDTAIVTYDDPNVERVRRAHLNDLENIPLFFVIGLVYCFTNPDPYFAGVLFKIFTAARIVHTFVYAVVVVPQPVRGIAWAVGQICIAYMAVESIIHFY